MTGLLCKLFIKDRENVKNSGVRSAYGMLASVVGIVLNVILAAGKYTVGAIFGAISLQADGINNMSDAISQIVSLVSFKMASKPADRDHPFGHARMEYVGSMIVSFFILLVGWELLRGSAQKIFGQAGKTEFSWIMIIVLGISVQIKLWLWYFNNKLAKKIDSSVLRATGTDSLADAIATLAVLVAMLVIKFTGIDIDGYMGVAVAVLIFAAGIRVLNETKNSILGSSPDPEVVDNIKRIVGEFPDALGIHDMVVHNYGPGRTIATLHIEVDGAKCVFESHDMIDLIEKRLREELSIESNIHMDPIVTDDEEINALRALVAQKVKEVDMALDIHDFRFVKGVSHSNLIFDISAPFEVKMSDSQIKDAVAAKIKEHNESFLTVTNVDRV
ncbi:MAG: cation transporter [Ruminococcaceae bacterium]|nr:cation transporter [Oscillospiraceae bacterium]